MIRLAKTFFFIVVGVVILVVATSFFYPFINGKKKDFTIHFENYVEGNVIKLDSGFYKNGYGQSYTVSKLRYYIGEINLINKNGGDGYNSHEYFLIDEDVPSSKNIVFKGVPDEDYN